MTVRDPGLQRERTAIAWSRTGLAILVNALVVVRAGANANDVLTVAMGIALVGSAVAAVAFGFWRGRRLAEGANPATPVVLVLATVAITWLACAAGLASILLTSVVSRA